MKQTAVEYLVEQLMPKALTAEQYYHIQQAKEMEKEQQQDNKMYSEEDMKTVFNVGFRVGYNDETSPSYLTAENFIEQFKKK